MNPLQIRLASLRRRLWLVVSFRGGSLVCEILLLAAAATGLIDWRVHLPSLIRAALLTGSVGLAGFVSYRYFLLPLLAKADDLTLALKVEARYPVLNDSLASAVQFLEQRSNDEPSCSPSLRREAVQRALERAKKYDFAPVVDTRGVHTAGLSFASAAALAVALSFLYPQAAWTAFLRLTDPFGSHDWPRQTQLKIDAPPRIARGEAYEIKAVVTGLVPERATVEYRFGQAGSQQDSYELRRSDNLAAGTLTARLDPSRVQHDFHFQVRANDAVSPWTEVKVLPPPQIVAIEGRPSPQIRLVYPEYTDIPVANLPDGTTSLEAPAGTQVFLRAATDRPIARAWLEYPQGLGPVLTAASLITSLAHAPISLSSPAEGWSSAFNYAGARLAAWRQIPAQLEPGGQVFRLEFVARVSGTFALHIEDELGIGNTRLLELHTVPDPAPIVNLQRPSRAQDSLDVLPDAEITLQILAEDPLYALRSVGLEVRRKRVDEPITELGRLPLYDHEMIGTGAAQVLSNMSAAPLRSTFAPFRLRPQQLVFRGRWPLSPLKLREGDVVTIHASADDFDDVTVHKQPGRSHEIELHVVSRLTLDLALNEMQTQIQQELLREEKLQQEALEKVIPAETHARNNKGRLQPQHFDDLLQAEQLQQQIRARIGTKEEGLRAAVARVQQTLRDNQVARSATQDRVDAVAAELDRLAREEMEPIEPLLTEARKATQGPADKPSPSEKDKAPLPEARKHQEEVKKTLTELLKLLEPWSTTREVKGEAKSILQEQRTLAAQTAKLAEKIDPGEKAETLRPELKAELDKTAELQNKLAERANQLLEKMDRLTQSRQKQDPETAQALKDAAEKGKESNVSGNMQDAEKSVRANNLEKAGSEQRASAQGMEEVVKALEDRREEELDKLIKKMKKAEEKLADLAERQDRLQKKTKEASQISDPAKRAEALKRLAREQEQLQRESQEMVRELSRLRAEGAGQTLSQASSRMSQAGRRMGQPEEAAQQQEEALDRLDDAQQQLQQAREEAEDELAREKLAKIADVIRGLRERQQSLTLESGRIQREVLQKKEWSRPLLASLQSLTEAQTVLGEESESITRDKLEGTKVFAHLLRKAALAMKQAAERMRLRTNPDDPGPDGNDGGLNVSRENEADAETQKLQKLALHRIDQLLEALKSGGSSPGRQSAKPQSGEKKQGEGKQDGGKEENAGESLPPLGQLQILRTLQQEINERTQAFAKEHPKSKELTTQQQAELKGLHQEQQEIRDLFQELTAPVEAQGEKK